jgi:putative ABC transport system substrate-binding protein
MRRRDFTAGLGAMLLAPRPAPAQQPAGRVMRVGRLSPQSASGDAPFLAALKAGLRELGWVEGQNVGFEVRSAEGHHGRLPDLAGSLVAEKVDVIVAGANVGGLAAKNATRSIPIVVVTTGDPIAGGLVASLARPGGNVTGVTALGQELGAKRLEVLKEIVPNARRVAVLANPNSPDTIQFAQPARLAAAALEIELQLLEVSRPDDLDAAFAAMARATADALLVVADIMFITHRRQIADLAGKHRLPAIYFEREFVRAGGLMFYGAGLPAMYRHAAMHVDKILRGAKPGDLPMEQPTRFELVINLKAAKSLGLAIPPSVLIRADELIE